MLYRVLEDLYQYVEQIYSGDNYISLAKVFHHSFKYPNMLTLFQKYRGNSKFVVKELYSYIDESEINKKKKIPSGRVPFNMGYQNTEHIFQEIADDYGNIGVRHFFLDKTIEILISIAYSYEAKKLQRQTNNPAGGTIAPEDLSESSMLRAIIEIASKVKNYAFILKILKDSKFNIEKFIKDEESGKSVRQKSIIDELCTNYNKKAEKGELAPVIGRDQEIEQVITILKKARKNNPVLVGRAGVGKTAIIEGLAQRIQKGDVPTSLKNAVIYELQVMNMVKGTQFRGVFEQKMSDLLEEFKEREDSGELPILFIDELHTVMGAGSVGEGGLDFSNIIKPALARGELRTIGSTTTDEWHKFIKENQAFDRRFVSVSIKEPSVEDTRKILQGSLSFFEEKHGVRYGKGTLDRAIELSVQFVVDNALPDKAVDLIDYAGSFVAVKNRSKVVVEDVEYALARQKNIDLSAILESRKDHMEPLAPKIKQVIFGQDQAVDKVCKTVEMAIAGLNSKDRPIGAFLFTGPTGSGKTELAKQIAKEMKANFHRLDMSAFGEAHSVAKLLGSPAGYVGYDEGSVLTKIINENPRTVLLLDEIEKSHPDVRKLFLQVMDYGSLTDSRGREINFRNTLLIMTSNSGVHTGRTMVMSADERMPTIDAQAIKNEFAPEFRGRLTGNGPIQFNPLSLDLLKKIVDKHLAEVQKERLDKLHVKLTITDQVREKIAQFGLDKQLGARPVRDHFEDQIVEQLKDLILFGELKGLKKDRQVKAVLGPDKSIKIEV